MTYSEAEKLIDKNKELQGRYLNKQEVSFLQIVPSAPNGISLIIQAILGSKSTELILNNYNDFFVAVFFDFDNFSTTGYLTWETLGDVILKQKEINGR